MFTGDPNALCELIDLKNKSKLLKKDIHALAEGSNVRTLIWNLGLNHDNTVVNPLNQGQSQC